MGREPESLAVAESAEAVELLAVSRHDQRAVEIVQTPGFPTQFSVYAAIGMCSLVVLLGISALGSNEEPGIPQLTDPVFMQEEIGAAAGGLVANGTPIGGADVAALSTTEGITKWPEPPEDHDPYVFGYPRPEVQLLGRPSGLALVYVNTLQRPTVVDLDTGMIHELEVAAVRTYDRFAIEAGDVVATGSALEDLANGSSIGATQRMITFHVHAGGDDASSLGNNVGSYRPGPHLCLSSGGCPDLGWTAESYTRGADSAQILNESNYAELLNVMAGPWDTGSRHSLVDFGPDLVLRMPRPLNDTVWVAHQP